MELLSRKLPVLLLSLLQVEVSESEMTPSYTSCAAAIISELHITDYISAADCNNPS